jgi:hypothetical protein
LNSKKLVRIHKSLKAKELLEEAKQRIENLIKNAE